MTQKQKKLCHRVLSFIDKTPWAIKPDALEKIISIANRSYSDPELVSAIKAQQSISATDPNDNADIAIIDVIGPIFTRADMFTEISGAVSLDSLERQIDAVLYDDAVRAIILRIDSPGGQVTGTHEFANYLDEACEIKPIVAYVTGMACSAAYWLASSTSYIYADKTATLGSIGVVATWTDESKARSNAGLVDYEVVSSQSPKKRLDPASDDGKAELQKNIDGLADIFIDDVALFRDVSRDKVLSDFGQGGTFLADEAISIGMADEISNLRTVISLLSSNNKNEPLGVTNIMGKQANRNRRNFTLKATGKYAEDEKDKNEELDQQGAEDFEQDQDDVLDKDKDQDPDPDADEEDDDINADDEQHQEEDDEHEPAANDNDSDNNDEDKKEDVSTRKAIKAFSRKSPNLYQAIIKRGARRERRRIASIDNLNVVGHGKLIKQAKYKKPLTAAQASLAVLQAEQSQRKQLSDSYQADAGFSVPTSSPQSASAAGAGQSADEKSFLQNIMAGAKAAIGVK